MKIIYNVKNTLSNNLSKSSAKIQQLVQKKQINNEKFR